jgi:hypothetical protein
MATRFDENDKSMMRDADAFVEALDRQVNDHVRRFSGNDKQVRYSPDIIRIAMSVWLDSPGAYERLKSSSLEVFP